MSGDKYKIFDSESDKLRKMWDTLTQLISTVTELSKQIETINIALGTLKVKKYLPDRTLDVKQKILIEFDNDGVIAKDENGHLKMAPLCITKEDGSIDSALSSIIWDKDAKVYRIYAVYAPESE
jgi:hypothetical protein